MHNQFFVFLFGLLSFGMLHPQAVAGFANYNSILIGNKAAGMGGAYTSQTEDPAAISFYNPSNLGFMKDNTLSTSVTLFSKYDVEFGKENQADEAPLRVNQGAIVPIPASGGTVYNMNNFSFGISIIYPDLDQFNGEIRATSTDNSYLNLKDSSLWIGGTLAYRKSQRNSLGLTMYYTSRDYSRSVTDRTTNGGVTTVFNEEKTFTQNSLIYIFGWSYQREKFGVGVSYRMVSLPISGQGKLFQATTSTAGANNSQTYDLRSETRVPERLNFGVHYTTDSGTTYAFDIHYYGKTSYRDVSDENVGDFIRHEPMANISLGFSTPLSSWLEMRGGVFSNLSSHPEIDNNPTKRQPDHIDMWGFSTNFGIFTTEHTSVTLGGYYSGGKGWSVQQVGQSLEKLQKAQQIFSFLVGTSHHF